MHRSGTERLDAVTIRIGVPQAQSQQAVEALGLRSIRPSRSVLHLIDYRAGSASSSLASAGVTISLRDWNDLSLLTVQVRHIRRAQLYPRWAAFYGWDRETLLVEEERDNSRRVLTASFCATRERFTRALTAAELRLPVLLSPGQWSFLQDCAPGHPQPVPLEPFGPIAVLSWDVSLDQIDAAVSLWRLPAEDGMTRDLMEVSRRSRPAEAGFLYPALAASIRRLGLDPDGGIPWLEARASQF